jgi:hypothetical protein
MSFGLEEVPTGDTGEDVVGMQHLSALATPIALEIL